jgi:hypothetical protein
MLMRNTVGWLIGNPFCTFCQKYTINGAKVKHDKKMPPS